jgi:hypothetical protein
LNSQLQAWHLSCRLYQLWYSLLRHLWHVLRQQLQQQVQQQWLAVGRQLGL